MSELLEHVTIDTSDNPEISVIWLHGLGADGNDFVPIVRELDLAGLPGIRFIFPHARNRKSKPSSSAKRRAGSRPRASSWPASRRAAR
jgi:predicted esterase